MSLKKKVSIKKRLHANWLQLSLLRNVLSHKKALQKEWTLFDPLLMLLSMIFFKRPRTRCAGLLHEKFISSRIVCRNLFLCLLRCFLHIFLNNDFRFFLRKHRNTEQRWRTESDLKTVTITDHFSASGGQQRCNESVILLGFNVPTDTEGKQSTVSPIISATGFPSGSTSLSSSSFQSWLLLASRVGTEWFVLSLFPPWATSRTYAISVKLVAVFTV